MKSTSEISRTKNMSTLQIEAGDMNSEIKDTANTVMDVIMESQEEKLVENENKSNTEKSSNTWSLIKTSCTSFNIETSSNQSETKNLTGNPLFVNGNGDSSNARQANHIKSMWSIRSSISGKANNIYSNAYIPGGKLYDRQSLEKPNHNSNNESAFNNSLTLSSKSSSSAFVNKSCKQQPLSKLSEEIQKENNILKRCNSAPILNDVDVSECTNGWHKPVSSSSGRIRRFSATVVSENLSPASGVSRSRLRLHQIQSEESFEGIQNKEVAHEREVHTTLQISTNCGDLSLRDRRSSFDNSVASSPQLPSPRLPSIKAHFPTPSNTLSGIKSSHSRAIDFTNPVHASGPQSPTHSHHPTPYIPPSSGIPSPLTLSTSPYHFNLSSLPPSPTRSICGPGKQCYSPSLLIPLPRGTSRSPSPSPTRHHPLISRRRSQSPCIMRPSAFAPTKRKYDSDSEGSCSPKRVHVQNNASVVPNGGAGDAHVTNQSLSNASLHHRSLIHRSHSLSSSSVDSNDIYTSPSPPNQSSATFVTHHHNSHQVAGFIHPLQYSSNPIQTNNTSGSQMMVDHPTRSSSPASSTCSSSSLEGLRELQPLSSPQQFAAIKKS